MGKKQIKMKSFSLIETFIATFVFLLLFGGVTALILNVYQTNTFQWQQSLAIAEAKKGIEIMKKEIRKAREGENGAYPIEKAGDKEFIFYSDVDGDGKTERVRYFLGEIQTETRTLECKSSETNYDGSCLVSFSNFLSGNLISAQLRISVQGDLNSNNEYVTITIDGQNFGNLCNTGCNYCPGNWEGATTVNVFTLAQDGVLNIQAQASCPNSNQESRCVNRFCSDNEGPFSFKARFELTITQETQTPRLKRGVIKATGTPPTYPLEQEKISIITPYVRNAPPIFEYYDENGNKIESYPARLANTKVMKIFLVVNVDPNRPPVEYQLQSFVELRNLKNE
jgi:hypothetical protein